MLLIGQRKFLYLAKLKILYHELMLLMVLMGKKFLELFFEKELQKTNQEEFRIEKIIKRKGNKLYVKWKGNDNSFNSCIDKKDIV